MKPVIRTLLLVSLASATAQSSQERQTAPGLAADYLTWTRQRAEAVGRSTRVDGRVGSAFDFRVIHTEHSYNYKLRATWLTDEVIRATARLAQISEGLASDHVEALVKEAEDAGGTIILVEIDPREGSGVIPLEWTALLQPKGLRSGEAGSVKGTSVPRLRDVRALSGVFRRDYDYDVFWIVFPLTSDPGQPLFPDTVKEAELVVRIHDKEGRVTWKIPDSVRRRAALLNSQGVASRPPGSP